MKTIYPLCDDTPTGNDVICCFTKESDLDDFIILIDRLGFEIPYPTGISIQLFETLEQAKHYYKISS